MKASVHISSQSAQVSGGALHGALPMTCIPPNAPKPVLPEVLKLNPAKLAAPLAGAALG